MKTITKQQTKEIAALKKLKDSDIDLSDIPELTGWSNRVVGKFYRPIKQPVTIRLDADILAWLKNKGEGYQTRINRLLRQAMEYEAGGGLSGRAGRPDRPHQDRERRQATR
jgi:uncharacterized protein (DUF4415 family)